MVQIKIYILRLNNFESNILRKVLKFTDGAPFGIEWTHQFHSQWEMRFNREKTQEEKYSGEVVCLFRDFVRIKCRKKKRIQIDIKIKVEAELLVLYWVLYTKHSSLFAGAQYFDIFIIISTGSFVRKICFAGSSSFGIFANWKYVNYASHLDLMPLLMPT